VRAILGPMALFAVLGVFAAPTGGAERSMPRVALLFTGTPVAEITGPTPSS
jgi:hypothetical protein